MQRLSFKVDGLTTSIVKIQTGEVFKTKCKELIISDLILISPKTGWKFNWKKEFKLMMKLKPSEKQIFKLITLKDRFKIQGLISISRKDGFYLINLIESAPFNQGKNKLFQGVAGNLVAFTCMKSIREGFGGYVSFYAKTSLIKHYEQSLGAVHEGKQLMVIYPENAYRLARHYFNI